MDARDSAGRTISLLCEASVSSSDNVQLPPHIATATSYSEASSPSLSSSVPHTPHLIRSSSADSRGLASPSPSTPSFNELPSWKHYRFFRNPSHQHHQHYSLQTNSNAKMDDQNASMYPPLPDGSSIMPSAYPMPPQMAPHQMLPQQQQPGPQAFRTSDSPASEPSRVSNVSAQSSQKPAQKKNQYPCPMAKQIGCTDFFTTSGHAARHAKKHTGKKDAFCPECNKAFTRKDNMEQHRRTHQNGRGTPRVNNDDAKVKKPTKTTTKKTNIKAEPALEAAVQQQLADQAQAEHVQQAAQAAAEQAQQVMQPLPVDQTMLMPATGPYFLGNTVDTGPVPALPMAMPDLNMRPPLQRSNYAASLEYAAPTASMIDPDTLHYSYPSPGLSNGLNSLALAASERRRSEKSQSRSPPSESSDHTTP